MQPQYKSSDNPDLIALEKLETAVRENALEIQQREAEEREQYTDNVIVFRAKGERQ